MTDDGVDALSKFLATNCTVTHLGISSMPQISHIENKITNKNVDELASAIRRNNVLINLDMRGNSGLISR
jgi:hypothetical protein